MTTEIHQISVVITDLDNTLFDWVEIWYKPFKAMLDCLIAETDIDQEVLEHDFRMVHQKFGTSEYAFSIEELPCLISAYPGEDLSVRFRSAIDEYRAKRSEVLKLYPGVLETLTTLQEKGSLLVGYTESLEYYTNYRMRKLNLDLLLDFLYSPCDHDLPNGLSREKIRSYPAEHYRLRRTIHRFTPKGHLKPDPVVLMEILSELGIGPGDAVYVGDSLMKDVAMAKAAGVTDVWATYGVAQNRQEYELLRRVSHWTDTVVSKEIKLAESEVGPTFKIASFAELLALFRFGRYMNNTDEGVSRRLDVWKKCVEVQQHFNDLSLRIRNFAVTLLVAVIGAAAFAVKDGETTAIPGGRISVATPIILAGIAGWIAFYFMDRFWYHRLLVGAVKQGKLVEDRLRKQIPEIGLTEAISKESPLSVGLLGRRFQIRSSQKIDFFYGLVSLLLLLMSIGVSFIRSNPTVPSGPPPIQIQLTAPSPNPIPSPKINVQPCEPGKRSTPAKADTRR